MNSNPRQHAASSTPVISRATQLSGTARIADDLYLPAHHERTGRPHPRPRAVGLGLAGALLAELVLPGAVRIWRGLVVLGAGPPPADALAHTVLSAIAVEREHLPARTWLVFLARTAAEDVASRLAEVGFLARARAVGWWPVGEVWAVVLMSRRPDVYEAIGRAPHAIISQLDAASDGAQA